MMIPNNFIYTDLTLREGYWIIFCMKLIAVIFHYNYYINFYSPSCLGEYQHNHERQNSTFSIWIKNIGLMKAPSSNTSLDTGYVNEEVILYI
jgi:hypothetical protein